MRPYVIRTEAEQGDKLRKEFNYIVEWYKNQYLKYNKTLQSEMDLELNLKEFYDITADYEELNYTFSFEAIMTPFCIADFLEKHILSTFSYGPEVISGFIQFPGNLCGQSWFKYRGDAVVITEVLKEYFKINNTGVDIELGILLEERFIRSSLTHTGSLELCMSIIRFYNVIRKMILFMDESLECNLPEFKYPDTISCDVQALSNHFDMENVENNTTILVVGSLHDISKSYLKYLANFQWNIVIDFDSYSEIGGLRSEANSSIVNSRILDNHTTNNITIKDNYIEWFNCGDYINPINSQKVNSSQSKLRALFPLRNYAHPGMANQNFFVWFRQRIDDIFRGVKNAQNPVSILYLNHDEYILKEIVNKAEEHLMGVSYTISAVYYWEEDKRNRICNECYQDDIRSGIDYSERFAIFPSDIQSFFSKTFEYFPSMSSTGNIEEKLLPSSDGNKIPSLNLQVELEKYFEVVYTNVGNEDYDIASKLINSFHKGGIAPWCAYAKNEVVNLIRRDDFTRWVSRIKSILGYLPDNSDKKIFKLDYKPGIGGTTILRMLAWELHNDYPVLIAQDYDKTVVRSLLQQLYDSQLKAFVVLADEDFDDIDDLERDIKVLSRPCVLIRAHRILNITSNSPQDFQLSVIKPNAENALRYKFRRISPLNEKELKYKEDNYSLFIGQDPSMKSPFFIGLYYIEKDFQHLADYVQQAFKGVYKDEEYRALGYIAFCDIYGNTSLPYIFINKILGIGRKNYLENNPYVKSILFMGKVKGVISAYKSKHFLISQEILNICSRYLFKGDYKDELFKWSDCFINDVITMLKENFDESYKTILEKIFTRNRVDTEYEEADFSKLIQDISIPEYRVQILEKLAKEAEQVALQFNSDENIAAYMMAAHFYGHLGRLFSKGISIVNYENAVKYSRKAKNFLEECSGQDYTIYHMYGEAKRLALKDKCDEYLQSGIEITNVMYNELENEIDDILNQYYISDETGNHVYAQSSSVLLLKDYLKFVYRIKNIESIEEMHYLSDRQAQYKIQIEEFLESLSEQEMDEKNRSYCQSLRDDFESGIMYNNYSHMEVYHQNKLDYEIAHQGSISSIAMHRSKLIFSKVGHYRTILPNGRISFMNTPARELEKMLSLLEQSFDQNIDSNSYRERKKRCNDYKLWMTLAKYSTRDVSQGIIYAKQWMNLVEIGKVNDPWPYYYLSVLYSLSVLEGNVSDRNEIAPYIKKACLMSSTRIDSVTQIRDILVKGKGLGQLCDISTIKDLGTLEAYRGIQPVCFKGQYKSASSKRGVIDLRIPEKWIGRTAKFSVGENNNMTESVITHMVSFYAGFCYEGITAINSSVIDLNEKEVLPDFVIVPIQDNKNSKVTGASAEKKKQQSIAMPEGIIDFIPLDKFARGDGYLITGTICEGKPAAVATDEMPDYKDIFLDLEQYVDNIIKMPKIPVICIGINKRGQYILSIKRAKITLNNLLEFRENRIEKKDNKKTEVTISEVVDILKKEKLPDIKGTVMLEKLTISKSEISGTFTYDGEMYHGRVTTGLSGKKVRDAKKAKRVKCSILQKNEKDYILRIL